MRSVFPFTAIVGQEQMKKALILNCINPGIGGVLIRGEKGTAKSTAVRGLASLLPDIEVVKDCKFNCDPNRPEEMCEGCKEKILKGENLPIVKRPMRVFDLPLGATEDRVVGTIDIEKAIKEGNKVFEPGILAEAHRGILYVDEVNLLDDHLVDILLDSAAMGVNIVEREGISFTHPARFILIGTMNPEEGELRPQLLDRFGLCVEVKGIDDAKERAEIIQRLEDFERNPRLFEDKWRQTQERLRKHILRAKEILPQVICTKGILNLIARFAIDTKVDGHRADVFMLNVAKTTSAYHQRGVVTEKDVAEAGRLVLPHRMKKRPPHKSDGSDQRTGEQSIKEQLEKDLGSNLPNAGKRDNAGGDSTKAPVNVSENMFEVGHYFPVRKLSLPNSILNRCRSGRRSKAIVKGKIGRYIGSTIPPDKTNDIAIDATIRAAAPYQIYRQRNGSAIAIEPQDIRKKIRERKVSHTIMFLVDASSSMGVDRRMVETKGAILSLLIDAYQKRDRVAMVTFRSTDADVLLPPTTSIELAKRKLEEMPTGGGTPLSKGLHVAHSILKSEMQKYPHIEPVLLLISDGEANVCLNRKKVAWRTRDSSCYEMSYYGMVATSTRTRSIALDEAKEIAAEIKKSRIKSIAIDTGNGYRIRHKMREICEALGGIYYKMEDLRAETIVSTVKECLSITAPYWKMHSMEAMSIA